MAARLLNTKTNVLPTDNAEIVNIGHSINPLHGNFQQPRGTSIKHTAREIQRE